jgi:REP element-mobilizing transposase RayT
MLAEASSFCVTGGEVPYWRLHYRLVCATKNRDPVIDEAAEQTIRQSISSASRALKLTLHAVGMAAAHIHGAVSISPSVLISEAVGRLKGAASHALRNGPAACAAFTWQAEYGALGTSGRSLDEVIDVVTIQPSRHAAHDFHAALERIEDHGP